MHKATCKIAQTWMLCPSAFLHEHTFIFEMCKKYSRSRHFYVRYVSKYVWKAKSGHLYKWSLKKLKKKIPIQYIGHSTHVFSPTNRIFFIYYIPQTRYRAIKPIRLSLIYPCFLMGHNAGFGQSAVSPMAQIQPIKQRDRVAVSANQPTCSRYDFDKSNAL